MRIFWLTLLAVSLGTKRHWQILVALFLGVSLGFVCSAPEYKPLISVFDVVGQGFIRLISMLVLPLLISSMMVGITAIGDARQLGRMGSKVLGYFMLFMSLSAVLGAVLTMVFHPGDTMQLDFGQLTPHAHGSVSHTPSLKELILDFIPKNPIAALAQMDLIPVVLFTGLFALAATYVGEAGRAVTQWFESLYAISMKMTDWMMLLAVPGVFALSFVTVATTGLKVFSDLAPYILIILLGLGIQLVIFIPSVLKLIARVSPLQFYRAISEALMVAFGTASSSATLPVTIACCERRAGISHRIASFVLPTGISVNKTATTLFEVIAVIFLAQAYGMPLEPHVLGLIMIFAIVASIGAPGVPGAGLITMAVVIRSIGSDYAPLLNGIAMLWSIDRVLDMCRTVVNVASSCTVATVVAAKEGELNRDMLSNPLCWKELI